MWQVVFMVNQAVASDATVAVARIEARYVRAPGFEAKFVQTTRSSWGESSDRGSLALQRPGQFRWDFAADGRVYACDGHTLVAWTPMDHTYLKGPAGEIAATPALGLLQSLDTLDEYFVVDLVSDDASGVLLSLVPRTPDGMVASVRLRLAVDLTVQSVVVLDALGSVTEVAFSEVRVGPIAADRFRFPPPVGATVIDATGGMQ